MHRESNGAAGKPMTKSKETLAREDGEAMATGCIWLETIAGAECLHFLNASHMLSARGLEVALIRPEWIGSIEVNEDVHSHGTPQNHVQCSNIGMSAGAKNTWVSRNSFQFPSSLSA